MNERLIQYLWQFQFYNKQELATTDGQPVEVLHPGQANFNQGPDFLNARIRIGQEEWAGHVEIHFKSSGWRKHGHTEDPNYKNVVLHVVWHHDEEVAFLPVLELNGRVPLRFLLKYEQMVQTGKFIPCEKTIREVPDLVWKKWKERLVVERLEHKSQKVRMLLKDNAFHWEETCWWLIAENFGGKVNGASFLCLAKSLPFNIIHRHQYQLHQIESLLLGQAGLLERVFHETYPRMLQKEYRFLQKKYKLKPIQEPIHFLRMRPGNFPSVRLAQLAVLLSSKQHLFDFFLESNTIAELENILSVTGSAYWQYHYRLEDKSSPCMKNLGTHMIHNIIINTVCPLLFAYGQYRQEKVPQEKAIRFLEEIPPEQHRIARGFTQLGIENKNAFDAQAFTELYNNYCSVLKCLDCAIGHSILKGFQDQPPQSMPTLISG